MHTLTTTQRIHPPTTRIPTPGRDRRAHHRLGFRCPVRFDSGSAQRTGTARDVSEHGAGFTTESLHRPLVGQFIRLVFELDRDREWVVDERALVTRCDNRDDGRCDVGVRLTLPEMA